MSFEWRTDEEDWDREPEWNGRPPISTTSRRPYLPLALILLGLLILAGWFLNRSATNQIDQTTGDFSSDILAAHSLLNQSILTNDLGLFESFLPPGGYGRSLPLDLFRYGYFLDRPFLNLYALDLPAEHPPQVTLSADLSRAELTSLQAYTPADQSAAQPIWLERLSLYRQVDGRWQLSRWPIDEAFWGETEELRVGLLTAEFPARDETEGQRLAQDIGRLLDDICTNPAITCPPNFRLKMLLQPYGQNLLDMNANYRSLPLSSGYDAYRIFLPTPSLVGRPIDEAGYQALYQGYASWIAAVLVQHYSQIRPVSHQVTADFLAQWNLSPPRQPVLPGPLVAEVEPPPIPFPAQDILLVCQGYSPATWLIYSPANDSWQTTPAPGNAPALAQLLQQAGQNGRLAPQGQGSLFRRPYPVNDTQSWHSFLWLGGLSSLLTADSPDLFLADPHHQQPDSSRLLFYPFDGQGSPYLAQTADCLAGNCRLETLAGIPVWSPSQQRTLLTIRDENDIPRIYLGDAQAQPLHYLTDGYSPQWLDENGFIFAGLNGSGIYNGRLEADNSLGQLDLMADMASFFSPQILSDDSPRRVAITSLALSPAQPDWVAIGLTFPDSRQDNLLLLNRQTNALRFGFGQANIRFAEPYVFSEDGRYLTIPAFQADILSGGWQLLVFDLNTPTADWQYDTGTAWFDWSADSQWLLIAEDSALRLIAPAHNYERQIPYSQACHTSGWSD